MSVELRPVDWFPLRLTDPEAHYDELRRRRAEAPVERLAAFGPAGPEAWLVVRHADVAAVLADGRRFSLGVVEERYGAVLGRSMLTLAPTARRALRRALADALHPRDDGLAALVDRVVAGRVEAVAAAPQPVDLVPLVAAQVPARVLASLLGLDEEDWGEIAALAAGATRLLEEPRAALRAARALRRRLHGLLAGEPRGAVAALAEAEVDGRPLDADELVASLLLLAWAGTETAFPAIATCLYALLAHPGRAEAVRRDPSLAPAAADEALRWEAPVQVTTRRALEQVELRGEEIPAGATVLAHLGSANRDEARFADPDTYDPTRPELRRHLAFGHGGHRCLGWQLARLELAATVRGLLAAFPRLRLVPGSPPPEGAVVRSPRRVLVEVS